MNGRFSIEWSRIQDNLYAWVRGQQRIKDWHSGHRWQIKFIGLIWKEWLKFWKLLNKELQNQDATTQAAADWWEIMLAIKHEVYAEPDQFEPSFQELLTREECKHMQRPLWVTRNLLKVNAPVIREKCELRPSRAFGPYNPILNQYRRNSTSDTSLLDVIQSGSYVVRVDLLHHGRRSSTLNQISWGFCAFHYFYWSPPQLIIDVPFVSVCNSMPHVWRTGHACWQRKWVIPQFACSNCDL